MELMNWGQRLLTAMTEVLDGERGVLSRDSGPRNGMSAPFDVRSDIESLLTTFKTSKLRENDRSLAVFRKLAPFFAAGFFLEYTAADASEWLVTDVFLLGRHFKPGDVSGSTKQPLPFAVPPLRVGQVVRGRGPAVIDGFQLAGVEKLRDTRAYVMRLSGGSAFLLLDDRPELWRELMIEKAYGVLMRLMADDR